MWNRTQVTYTDLAQPVPYQANTLNQYISINQQVPTYDANGNLTAESAEGIEKTLLKTLYLSTLSYPGVVYAITRR